MPSLAEVFPPLGKEYDNQAFSIAFSPDRTHIVSDRGDGIVWVWDAISGTEIHSPL
jgi:WD40 repeat protein